jgi:hypothetical protein
MPLGDSQHFGDGADTDSELGNGKSSEKKTLRRVMKIVYSGVAADIVMESFTLIDPAQSSMSASSLHFKQTLHPRYHQLRCGQY